VIDAGPLAARAFGGTESTFALVEWSDSGETSRERPVAPLHLHRGEDEAWYVLEGRLGFRVGDDEVEAGAGEAVLARRGMSHTYWNAGRSPVRYVLVMGPRTFALVEAIHATTDSSLEAMRALFDAHDSELLA
jgi:mannose-6-phosphate isomerase-like protein (cupin superfamily)